MFELYLVAGGVAVFLSVIGILVWVSRSGAADGVERDRLEGLAKRRRKADEILARGNRSRAGLLDWMRKRND